MVTSGSMPYLWHSSNPDRTGICLDCLDECINFHGRSPMHGISASFSSFIIRPIARFCNIFFVLSHTFEALHNFARSFFGTYARHIGYKHRLFAYKLDNCTVLRYTRCNNAALLLREKRESMSVLDQLRESLSDFSSNERHVADYILNSPQDMR